MRGGCGAAGGPGRVVEGVPRQLLLRLAALTIDAETMRRGFGWDPAARSPSSHCMTLDLPELVRHRPDPERSEVIHIGEGAPKGVAALTGLVRGLRAVLKGGDAPGRSVAEIHGESDDSGDFQVEHGSARGAAPHRFKVELSKSADCTLFWGS